MAEVSALVFVTRQHFLYCWNTHGENNSLKSRCSTDTVSCVNLAFVSLQSLDSKILFHASSLSAGMLEQYSGFAELE